MALLATSSDLYEPFGLRTTHGASIITICTRNRGIDEFVRENPSRWIDHGALAVHREMSVPGPEVVSGYPVINQVATRHASRDDVSWQ